MIRKSMVIGAAAALSLSLAAPAMAAPLKIGAVFPMTGDLQAYGAADIKGLKLAVQEINEAGGVLGEDIQYVVGDAQTLPQAGVDAAQKLISIEGANAIVGALSSGVTIPVASSVTSVEKVPQVSPASTSPVISTLNDDDFLFRTVPSDAFQGVALAQITQEAGYGEVAVIYINNDYGKGLAQSFREAFEAQGGEVTASIAYEPGQAAYRGELENASQGDPEALVLIAYPQNGQVILRQSLEGAYFTNFVFTDGMKAPEIIENIGAQYLNGSIGTSAQARKDTQAYQHFASAYQETYGEVPPKPYIDTSYDAVYVLALAAQAAGSTDSVAIRDHIRDVANPPGEPINPGEWEKAVELLEQGKDIAYQGASGPINFDEQGDVSGTFAHWEIADGEIQTVRVFEPKVEK